MISAIEFVGPCRFGGWAEEDVPELDIVKGDPIAVPHPRAWIQIAAVSKEQTKNTMTIFPGLFTDECKVEHGIDVGKEIIYAYHGERRIEAVTSSPRALEGGRPTLVIANETHHWLSNNEGHDMADVIERNTTKSKHSAARVLSITNAYEPSEDSVAQRQREAWEAERAGLSIDTGTLYDSLEAPPDAMLALPKLPDGSEPSEEQVRAYIGAVIRGVRGDAVWLDVDGIVNSILRKTNKPSKSRRFWYNQIVASEDAWLDPAAVDEAIDPIARDARRAESDHLRAGWLILPTQPIVMFFDGSKSDDATALVGCRLSDGQIFTFGVWQKPAGDAGKGWRVPRHEVDNRVEEVMDRFTIVAYFGDPSHTKDDDAERYWDGLLDDWHRRYKDRLQLWSTQTGLNQHSIVWDMTSPERTKQFVAAAEVFVKELMHRNRAGKFEPQFLIDGHPALVQHLKNAKQYPTGYGVSLWKGHRESPKKVDLAVAAVGARMLRRLVLNRGLEETESKGGSLWGS